MWPEIEPDRTRCLAPHVIKGTEPIIKRIAVEHFTKVKKETLVK